jgi:hypothetical protein
MFPKVGMELETAAATVPADTVAMNFRLVKSFFFIIINIDYYIEFSLLNY